MYERMRGNELAIEASARSGVSRPVNFFFELKPFYNLSVDAGTTRNQFKIQIKKINYIAKQ